MIIWHYLRIHNISHENMQVMSLVFDYIAFVEILSVLLILYILYLKSLSICKIAISGISIMHFDDNII